MMRRVFATALASVAAQRRNRAVYSEQSEDLVRLQKEKGYESNVWVEQGHALMDTFARTSAVETKYALPPLITGEQAYTVKAPKLYGLYNLSQVENTPETTKPGTPHDYFTKKPLDASIVELLQRKKAEGKFESDFWVSGRDMLHMRLTPKKGARAVKVQVPAAHKVFNACQFTDWPAVAKLPVSGGSRRILHGPMVVGLNKHTQEKGYATGLYFTAHQIAKYGLKLKDAQKPFPLLYEQTAASEAEAALFNLDQLSNRNVIVESMKLSLPGASHKFLPSFDDVQYFESAEAKDMSKYWVWHFQMELLGAEMKVGTKPLKLKCGSDMFNVAQLVDPSAGFAKAGTSMSRAK